MVGETEQVRSQPTPVAPGPNWVQKSLSVCWVWRSSSRVPSATSVSSTATQLVAPMNSQVTAKACGGSQVWISPPALPSTW